MSNFIGMDPGQSGGIASVGDIERAIKMPLTGKDIDVKKVVLFLLETQPDLVIIEKVGAMPKQGLASTFNFGKGYGILIGIVESLGLPYQLVTPQAWKKRVLEGTSKDKEAAIGFARRRYPAIPLVPERCKKAHDGIADAICLAHYGRST